MYQSIHAFTNGDVHVGDPTALSFEPLIIWLTNLMDVYQKYKELN